MADLLSFLHVFAGWQKVVRHNSRIPEAKLETGSLAETQKSS